jgi:hypothetical protein
VRELVSWWRDWVERMEADVAMDPEASREAEQARRKEYRDLNYQRALAWLDFVDADRPTRQRILDSGVFGRTWYGTRGARPLLEGREDTAQINQLTARARKAVQKADAAVRQVIEEIAAAQAVAPGGRILAVELELGEVEVDLGGRPLTLVGRVDRLEWDPGRQRIIICDYKTGAPTTRALSAAVAAGHHLQLPLYALAVEALVDRGGVPGAPPGARVGMLRLEHLKRRGAGHATGAVAPGEVVGVDEEGRAFTAAQAAARFAGAYVEGMRAGWFPCVRRGYGADPEPALEAAMRAVPGEDERAPGLPLPLEKPGATGEGP